MRSFSQHVKHVSFELVQSAELDPTITCFDFTKITAYSTCPTWGILRYDMHKVMPGGTMYRELALEAGQLCHDAFAALRLYELSEVQGERDQARIRGVALFGDARWGAIVDRWTATNTPAGHLNSTVAEVVATSAYYDDPRDRRRTLANIESSLLAYASHWQLGRYPVYVAQPHVGIEVPFALLVTFTGHDGEVVRVYYIGKMDGLHVDPLNKRLIVMENKTGSRIDDVWRASFATSHQVTGYMLAASAFTRESITHGMVIGNQIPLPKSYAEGVVYQPVRRDEHQFRQWFAWLWHALEVHRLYKDDIKEAPKFTHSCNRYFRMCPFIPFCIDTPDGMDYTLQQMETKEWSPLHEQETNTANE